MHEHTGENHRLPFLCFDYHNVINYSRIDSQVRSASGILHIGILLTLSKHLTCHSEQSRQTCSYHRQGTYHTEALTHLPLDKMAAILAGYNFKCTSLNDDDRIPIRISLRCVFRSAIDNNSALVQVMAWHRTGAKPLSESMLAQFTDAYMRHLGWHVLTNWSRDQMTDTMHTAYSTAFSLKFVPKGPINNIPVLVQIMAWCPTGEESLSEPMMI